MTNLCIGFMIGLLVGAGIIFDSFDKPQRGTIICHADGTTFIGAIDTQGIELADLTNAVGMMCRYRKDRMGV